MSEVVHASKVSRHVYYSSIGSSSRCVGQVYNAIMYTLSNNVVSSTGAQ